MIERRFLCPRSVKSNRRYSTEARGQGKLVESPLTLRSLFVQVAFVPGCKLLKPVSNEFAGLCARWVLGHLGLGAGEGMGAGGAVIVHL